MSLENVGIGGVMTFNGQAAISGMGQVAAATTALQRSQSGLQASTTSLATSFNSFGAGALRAGLALAPLTAGLTLAIGTAASFEQQMSGVKAVSMATDEEMAQLTLRAKQLGASTVFTATEAGSAMEELSRAGASANEVMASISGVMNAAAADSIDLATSASIVSNVIRGMGLNFDQANRVADVLALTSAKTNTDMIGLGESFKYAAAQARTMKIPLETTAALLGAAADSGLKGSIGGTSFTNMLVKLADPTEKAVKWMKANKIEMTKLADGGLDVAAVIAQVSTRLSGMSDVMEKGAITTELFGLRGQKAFNAIEASIQQGRLPVLLDEITNKSKGAAEQMAKTRLDNFLGQMKLLKSAVETFAIETGGMFLKPFAEGAKGFAEIINNVTQVLQALNSGVTDTAALEKQYGATTVAVAQGIRDGLSVIIEVWREVTGVIRSAISQITGEASPNFIRMLTKWITMLFVVAAAVAPIIAAMGAASLFIGSVVIPALKSIAIALGVIISATQFIGIIFATVFFSMQKEGESFGSVMQRIWNTIIGVVQYFRDSILTPIITIINDQIRPAFEMMRTKAITFAIDVQNKFQQLFGGIILAVQRLEPLFSAVFRILGKIIGGFVQSVILAFQGILQAVGPVFNVVKEFGIWLIENIVNGLQTVVKLAVKAADALNLTKDSPIWAELAFFASQPEFKITDAAGKVASVNAAQNLGRVEPPKMHEGPAIADTTTFATAASENAAIMKGAMTKAPAVNVGVDITDKRQLDINNCVTMDGREMAVAQGRYKQEINERAGFQATPWQRRQILEQGSSPVGGGQ